MHGFTLITGSAHKTREYKALLPGVQIDTAQAEIDEVQSSDLEHIALKKARAAYALFKKPVVVDDTGFYLDHWKGLPGPFMKYFEDTFGVEALIRILGDATNRRGYARTCIAYCDGVDEFVVSGEVHGEVTHEVRGPLTAFGFDVCFVPDGHTQTYAEMGDEKKLTLSHRFHALQAFKKKFGIE